MFIVLFLLFVVLFAIKLYEAKKTINDKSKTIKKDIASQSGAISLQNFTDVFMVGAQTCLYIFADISTRFVGITFKLRRSF